MRKKDFKYDWLYVAKTTCQIVGDSMYLYDSLVSEDIHWVLVYLLVIVVRLYLVVTLLYDYWEIHKMKDKVNSMEYFKESFKDQIIRHHICY